MPAELRERDADRRAPAGARTAGESTNTPTSMSSAPRPTNEMPLPPKSPRNSTRTPSGEDHAADGRGGGTRLIGRSSATARIAAIGGTRAAWRAGTIGGEDRDDRADEQPDDDRVRPQHDAAARDLEADRVHDAPSARSTARCRRRRRSRSRATPTTTDSPITDPSTCRRVAPIARSSAISRMRCATTIENVL